MDALRVSPVRGSSLCYFENRMSTLFTSRKHGNMTHSTRSIIGALTLLYCASSTAATPANLNAVLQPHLARFSLPALAAAVVKEGEIVAAGAVGTRQAGTRIPVTLDDRFHLDSDTKAMTSLLAGMLVEQEASHRGDSHGPKERRGAGHAFERRLRARMG